ncbi:MAG: NAD-dependent protein deacylase [Rubrivivax sp.]|nr:NAD-dependent protein deacylase [Rubrivivax sp.]MCL4697847.1 NAD-dependent protein deacylase [Burkholderiaceae bacterium]
MPTLDLPAPDPSRLAEAREAIAAARRVVVLTGAGMSAESGIATFRDALTGLWSRFNPEELASVEGFCAAPERVWDWYAERREGVRRAQPNAGHEALAAWARAHPGRMCVVTQNVDDLHQRAGQPDVVRLHGDILAVQWLDESACRKRPRCDPAQAAEASPGRPPRCAHCGNLARPGVVWFGEALPTDALDRAQRLADECEVMLVVGTSGAVWPAAGLAGRARRGGARVVIVNPDESEIDGQAHLVLRGTAARALPRLLGAAVGV